MKYPIWLDRVPGWIDLLLYLINGIDQHWYLKNVCGQKNLLEVPGWFDILLALEMNLHGVLNVDSLTCKYSHAVLFRGIPRYFEQYSESVNLAYFQSFKKTLKFHNVMACLPEQGPQEPGKLRTISREGKKGEPLTLLQATWEKKLFFKKFLVEMCSRFILPCWWILQDLASLVVCKGFSSSELLLLLSNLKNFSWSRVAECHNFWPLWKMSGSYSSTSIEGTLLGFWIYFVTVSHLPL